MPVHGYLTYRKLVLDFRVQKNMTTEYMNVFSFVIQISTRATQSSDSVMESIARVC